MLDLHELIKACASQDRKAQELLYERYKNILFALCLKYCANQAEAEDNLHNAFIEIFSNIKKFNHQGSFEGWMKRITINKAIDSYKKKYNLVPLKDDFKEETDIEAHELDFPLAEILKLVQELPNQYRLVFCLYELDDYPHHEIAKMLSISEGTSKSNLHRAKLILKEKIKSRMVQHYNIRHGK